jgi:hypothetical protein
VPALAWIVIALLLASNAVTAALLVRRRRPVNATAGAVEVFEAPRPPGVSERSRRLITIEILNPRELATSRAGRIAGLASTVAPGLTRRVVYDQTYKTLRRELDRMAVQADVRLHTLRPVPRSAPAQRSVIDAVVVDEVAPLDL